MCEEERTIIFTGQNNGSIVDGISIAAKEYSFYRKEKNELKIALKTSELPPIIFDVRQQNYLSCTSKKQEVRIVISDNDNISLNGYAKEDFSHYILICTKESVSSEFDWKIHIRTKEEGCRFIKIVYFDIVMFHYFRLHEEYTTVKSKREFNLLKKEFLQKKGKVVPADQTYVSFLNYFYNENKFDFDSYVKLWREFISGLKFAASLKSSNYESYDVPLDPNSNHHLSYAQAELIAEDVIKTHKKAKQISKKRLISTLINTNYDLVNYLVRLERKPKNGKTRKDLLNTMHLKKYRYGKIRIISTKEIRHFERLVPYVSIYKLK